MPNFNMALYLLDRLNIHNVYEKRQIVRMYIDSESNGVKWCEANGIFKKGI